MATVRVGGRVGGRAGAGLDQLHALCGPGPAHRHHHRQVYHHRGVAAGDQADVCGGLQRLPGHTRHLLHHPGLPQEAPVPEEPAAPAPLRVVHAARAGRPPQVVPAHGRHRPPPELPAAGRGALLQRRERDLDMQADDQRVAVLHPGQLLLAPDGGLVPAQPHLHGALHRLLRHHPLYPPRMGVAARLREPVGHPPGHVGRRALLDGEQRAVDLLGVHPGARGHLQPHQLLLLPERGAGPRPEAQVLHLSGVHEIQEVGQVNAGVGPAVRCPLLHAVGALHLN